MKRTLYSILLYILVFAFTIGFFNGVSLPVEPLYWLATVGIFAVMVLLHRPVLRFLTVKVNFITFLLVSTLLSIGAFYVLELVMPEFTIAASVFDGLNAGSITINSFELTPLFTMIVASFVYAAICALMEGLKGTMEE